jgi:hypothetical protein
LKGDWPTIIKYSGLTKDFPMVTKRQDQTDTTYLAYLLRLQLVDNAGQFEWRASLEVPGSHEQMHFASIEDLFGFLQEQMKKIDGTVSD